MSMLAEQVRRFGFITPSDIYGSDADDGRNWIAPRTGHERRLQRRQEQSAKYSEERQQDKREERRLSRQADIDWAASTTLEARRAAEKALNLHRRARLPEHFADWEAEALRANRFKVEKECSAFLKQQGTDRLERQERVEKAEEEKLTREQVEWSLGMPIKTAKRIYVPGPLCDGKPVMSEWIVGRHAHPSLWDWDD